MNVCKLFTLTLAIGLLCSSSASAIPIYVVDAPNWPLGFVSSKIIVMDSVSHAETVLNTGTGHEMTDIAITPSGSRLYTVGGTAYSAPYLYRFDPITGQQLGSEWHLGLTTFNNTLVAESETLLLVMADDSTHIWRIHLDVGGDWLSTEDLGDIGVSSAGDLAFSPSGELYLSSVDNRLYTIDLSGGPPTATEIGIINVNGTELTQVFGLAFDENGILYGGRGNPLVQDIYTISLNDASATYAWSMTNAEGIFGFASVPEPATVALLGLGSLTLLRRKRRA